VRRPSLRPACGVSLMNRPGSDPKDATVVPVITQVEGR
jgi:hypothetical protein